MTGSASAKSGQLTESAAKPDKMASSSGEAAESGENAGTTQAVPSLRGAAGLTPALPRRIGGIPLPAAPPTMTIQPPADLEFLRRVLDGLKRL